MPGNGRLVGNKRAVQACRGGVSMAALAAALSLPFATPAGAETLRQALTAAYQTNPKLDAERAKLRANDEDVSRAEAGYRPLVEGSAEVGRQKTSSKPTSSNAGTSEPWGYSISLRQNVFNGFQTSSSVAEASASVKAGRENLRLVEANVLLEGVGAYMDVVRDMGIVKIRESNVDVLSRELEAAETRREVKEVTKTDVAQARARRARAVSDADLAKANLKVSRANYERVIGHPAAGVGTPPLKLKQIPHSIEDAWRTAEQLSPNVNSALFREEEARFAVDKVRGELLPEINVEANYGHRENPSTAFDEQDAASVTGRFTVSLYDGGEIRARVRQAKHTQIARLQEIEQARTETQANVTSAWSRLMAARAQLKSDTIQVEANGTALEGVREEEKVGQRTLLDVLNAEQEYQDAQIQLATTRRDLVVAGYQLLASIGTLDAETLELGSDVYDPEAHFEEARQNWFGISITDASGRRQAFDVIDPENAPDDIVE